MNEIPCPKCKGSGQTEFSRHNGICYPCKGKGKIDYSPDLNIPIDDFLVNGLPPLDEFIGLAMPCKMTKNSLTVLAGDGFFAYSVGKNIILWQKSTEAHWHFDIPTACIDLVRQHFNSYGPDGSLCEFDKCYKY